MGKKKGPMGRRKKVYEMLKKRGVAMSVGEIWNASEIRNYNSIKSALLALTNYGVIERVSRGRYRAL